MQTNLYSVYDNKACIFCRPFACQTDAAAIRDFINAAQADTDIGRNPADYVLYRLATFQDVTGVITPEPQLVNLGLASTLAYSRRTDEVLNTLLSTEG